MNNVHECLETIEYVCKQHSLNSLIVPLQCVKEYITKLERENLGLHTTNDNLQEKLEKIGGYHISKYGKGIRRKKLMKQIEQMLLTLSDWIQDKQIRQYLKWLVLLVLVLLFALIIALLKQTVIINDLMAMINFEACS